MADISKSLNKLTLTWQFENGRTRSTYINEPTLPPDITLATLKQNIKNFKNWTVANQILIDENTGGTPLADSDTAIKTAYIDYGTRTTLDLS